MLKHYAHLTRTASVWIGLSVGIFCLILLTAGCHNSSTSDKELSAAPSDAPQRVISLMPATTETLCDLGIGSRLIGVTSNDHFPPEVEKLPKVGGMPPNTELILSLNPDLVVTDLSIMPAPSAIGKRKMHLPVLDISIQTMEQLRDQLPKLGESLHLQAEAQRLLEELDQEEASIKQVAKGLSTKSGHRPSACICIWFSPLTTGSQGSLLHESLECVGLKNVFAKEAGTYPTISVESLLAADPDYLITTEPLPAAWTKTAPWQDLRAVREHRVITIDPDLLQRPTKRHYQGLKQIQQFVKENPAP